eukprot:m.34053 g.34053  ORF g.34053 m.34053 type:complete len:55 (-) comp12270_c0_seq2:521-685(-)
MDMRQMMTQYHHKKSAAMAEVLLAEWNVTQATNLQRRPLIDILPPTHPVSGRKR